MDRVYITHMCVCILLLLLDILEMLVLYPERSWTPITSNTATAQKCAKKIRFSFRSDDCTFHC